MRIAIDSRKLDRVSMVGVDVIADRWTRSMIASDTTDTFILCGTSQKFNMPHVTSRPLLPPRSAAAWAMTRLPMMLRINRPDVLFMPLDYLPPRAGTKTKLVGTILDLAPITHARYTTPKHTFRTKLQLWDMSRRADWLVAISESSKRDFLERYSYPADRIEVAPCGYDAGRFRMDISLAEVERVSQKYTLPDEYILYVGTLQARKNLDRLIKAYELYRQRGGRAGLVLGGKLGWKSQELQRAYEESPNRADIHLIGFVEADDLPGLYKGASLFALVSLYEGFGIPVLEAMACGVPVITSRVSSLPEAGGEAAYYIDPLNIESIAQGVERVLSERELREQMVTAGLVHVKKFSWDGSAARILEVLHKCVAA